MAIYRWCNLPTLGYLCIVSRLHLARAWGSTHGPTAPKLDLRASMGIETNSWASREEGGGAPSNGYLPLLSAKQQCPLPSQLATMRRRSLAVGSISEAYMD
jgi:hypothetical protein